VNKIYNSMVKWYAHVMVKEMLEIFRGQKVFCKQIAVTKSTFAFTIPRSLPELITRTKPLHRKHHIIGVVKLLCKIQ